MKGSDGICIFEVSCLRWCAANQRILVFITSSVAMMGATSKGEELDSLKTSTDKQGSKSGKKASLLLQLVMSHRCRQAISLTMLWKRITLAKMTSKCHFSVWKRFEIFTALIFSLFSRDLGKTFLQVALECWPARQQAMATRHLSILVVDLMHHVILPYN